MWYPLTKSLEMSSSDVFRSRIVVFESGLRASKASGVSGLQPTRGRDRQLKTLLLSPMGRIPGSTGADLGGTGHVFPPHELAGNAILVRVS